MTVKAIRRIYKDSRRGSGNENSFYRPAWSAPAPVAPQRQCPIQPPTRRWPEKGTGRTGFRTLQAAGGWVEL